MTGRLPEPAASRLQRLRLFRAEAGHYLQALQANLQARLLGAHWQALSARLQVILHPCSTPVLTLNPKPEPSIYIVPCTT